MATTYEQFRACLPNSAARRLIGIAMTDDEAAVLLVDSEATRAYYEIWSATQNGSRAAPEPSIQQEEPVVPVERELLNIQTIGRGGEPAKVRVTTTRLLVSTTGGVSAWKTFFGVATLGVSTAVTGINAGVGGNLDIPIRAVSTALTTKTGIAYSTIKLNIGGDAVEFGLATVVCEAVVDTINAAVSGGHRSATAAQAWALHTQGRAKQWPSERYLRKQLRNRQIDQQQFEHDAAVSRVLRTLAMI